MISYLFEYFELAAGYMVMSDTPAGVGPVAKDDFMEVYIEGMIPLVAKVVRRWAL